MRKVFSTQFYIVLLCTISVISATFVYANNYYNQACTDTAECSKPLETNELNDNDGLLWESLSRQFVISIVPN